jgi:O-6-methylguanine DNA methyltransferase
VGLLGGVDRYVAPQRFAPLADPGQIRRRLPERIDRTNSTEGRLMNLAVSRKQSTTPILTAWIDSPLGPLLAGSVPDGVCLLEFGDPARSKAQLAAAAKAFCRPTHSGDGPLLEQLRGELVEYFAGTLREFTVPLAIAGTPFQCKVWAALRAIPYGETCSYGELAASLGMPGAARAVGHANGQNRMAVIIPCHRVIAAGGALGGYGGGLERKRFLLELEGYRVPAAGAKLNYAAPHFTESPRAHTAPGRQM